jgi:hypothetical protein
MIYDAWTPRVLESRGRCRFGTARRSANDAGRTERPEVADDIRHKPIRALDVADRGSML